MVKKEFDMIMTSSQISLAQHIIDQAEAYSVTRIINVGTSLVESKNCIELARTYAPIFATVGLHPNDCTESWRTDLREIECMIQNKGANKIVGIGECGMDRHYENYDIQRQADAFKAQIELSLEYELALVIHSRDAADETLRILDEYRTQLQRVTMHCFSYDLSIARDIIAMGFVLGIGATITYPKNEELRKVVCSITLKDIVLETDAPFLPPQIIRGKQNHPLYIELIARKVAELRQESFESISEHTTENALRLFNIK
jgi:TatD DNase family protein